MNAMKRDLAILTNPKRMREHLAQCVVHNPDAKPITEHELSHGALQLVGQISLLSPEMQEEFLKFMERTAEQYGFKMPSFEIPEGSRVQ